MTTPLVSVVLVDRRHERDCDAWHAAPPWDCTCGLTPEWVCLCGARNRLRDTTCRACGYPKPDWKDDYDDRRD